MDLRQSPNYAHFMEKIGWQVEKIAGCQVFVKRLPLVGSIIKIQRPGTPIPFEKIDQLAKKYRAIATYLEPDISKTGNWKLETGNYNYHLSKSPFLPTKTIHLDLAQSEGKILAGMAKDARYGIRKAKEQDIKILTRLTARQGYEDIGRFHQAWKKSVGWLKYVPSLKTLAHLKKAFGKKAIFLTGNWRLEIGNCLAGTVILIAGKTAYYYQAFTAKEGRKKFAQYLLVWEAIKEAKKQGCKIFDFEGIYDERFPQKSWLGFSHFKKSFGGKELEYPGNFTKFYNPILRFISKLQIPI